MARPQKAALKPLDVTVEQVGTRLARLRKLRGYSQQALADLMGISQKQITDYETGRVRMSDQMVIRFALCLKVSSDKLLGLDDLDLPDDTPSIRFTKRLHDLEQLPEPRKRAIIKMLDDLIRTDVLLQQKEEG